MKLRAAHIKLCGRKFVKAGVIIALLSGVLALEVMSGPGTLYVANMKPIILSLTLKESVKMKYVSHFKRICMYGEEGRLLIFFNRIYVFHSYQRFRWLLEITDS